MTRVAKRSIVFINQELERLQKRKAVIQNRCAHANRTYKAGSSTGHYDPSDDIYWKDFHCPDCDKRWTEDVR